VVTGGNYRYRYKNVLLCAGQRRSKDNSGTRISISLWRVNLSPHCQYSENTAKKMIRMDQFKTGAVFKCRVDNLRKNKERTKWFISYENLKFSSVASTPQRRPKIKASATTKVYDHVTLRVFRSSLCPVSQRELRDFLMPWTNSKSPLRWQAVYTI
jgi:hypothetical protein